MQFKHKLIYFALGCAFVVIAQVLLSVVVPKVTAQGKKEAVEFDTVKVRCLQVVDDAGKVRAQLEVTKRKSEEPMDDVIQVFNDDGVSVYEVSVSTDGGNVFVNDKNQKRCASMMVLTGGGAVDVSGDTGAITISDNDGKRRVCMDRSFNGGSVHVLNNDGNIAVAMNTLPNEGGCMSVINGDKIGALMYMDDYGGRADFNGNDNKTRAVIGVNEYGHGAISTWDKDGYRLR